MKDVKSVKTSVHFRKYLTSILFTLFTKMGIVFFG